VPRFEAQTGYRVKLVAVGTGQALALGERGDADVVLVHAPEAERALIDSGYFVRRLLVVSRGDKSGTEMRERMLWKKGGLAQPHGHSWYIESGQGMGATLQMASEKDAYTLTDIGTYLAWKSKIDLVPLVQGDPELYNVYHVLEPNPRNAPRINVAGGRAFADFMVDSSTQRIIGEFGKTRFGQSLFIPDAGKPDQW